MNSTAAVRGTLQIPMSSDSAQKSVRVESEVRRRRGDLELGDLLRRIAEAYQSYHVEPSVDSIWVEARGGQRRLRLIGRLGTEAKPQRRYLSVDLEEFQ